MFNTFCASSKLINTFTGHTETVWSIDYSTFNDCQFICSGSWDKTVRVWDVDNNKQVQSFDGHSGYVYCVKFSSYHYRNYHQNIICSSSYDRTIRFWDFKHNTQLQTFNKHTNSVYCIEVSSFSSGRYLCSGSGDNSIRLWDLETSKSLYCINGHENNVRCIAISPLQIGNHQINNIGVIGGNGYTICSGSSDKTIRIWDIEKAKQFRLWDIRSGKQIQLFNGHKRWVYDVEYSSFVINDTIGNSNVICSGSTDNTIRFWDIRSNKNELFMIKGDDTENDGIICLKFIELKAKENKKNQTYYMNLCYDVLFHITLFKKFKKLRSIFFKNFKRAGEHVNFTRLNFQKKKVLKYWKIKVLCEKKNSILDGKTLE
ncbi:WD-40 repeat protein [Reticulomyxa filosa]|uniref:WD-40 repeat protein n=1 Tax=Reticulomyxa filosa TaxID=46433 RepID=X6LN13_RETFI|nr:WD-40 repeat protein [Reticulomyxa filosa]|eukprot:ETO02115.1 WD-40 repeat protein [Reticulomyxa filosa]